MRAFWLFLAAIATPVLAAIPNPVHAQQKAPALTATPALPPEPVAEQRPHSMALHGVTFNDPWHWLKDQGYPVVDDPDVLAYLKAENAYFDAAMAPKAALTERLFQEMRGRIKEADASVPQKRWRMAVLGRI